MNHKLSTFTLGAVCCLALQLVAATFPVRQETPPYHEHTYWMTIDMEPNTYAPNTLNYWGKYLLVEDREGATWGTFCLGHARGYDVLGQTRPAKPEQDAGFNGSNKRDGWFPYITAARQLLPWEEN